MVESDGNEGRLEITFPKRLIVDSNLHISIIVTLFLVIPFGTIMVIYQYFHIAYFIGAVVFPLVLVFAIVLAHHTHIIVVEPSECQFVIRARHTISGHKYPRNPYPVWKLAGYTGLSINSTYDPNKERNFTRIYLVFNTIHPRIIRDMKYDLFPFRVADRESLDRDTRSSLAGDSLSRLKYDMPEECALVTKRLKAAAAPYMEMLVESWKIEGFQVAVDYFYKQYQEGQDISFAIDRLVGALARHAHEDGLSCHAGKLLNLLTFYAWQGDKQSMQIRESMDNDIIKQSAKVPEMTVLLDFLNRNNK